MDLDAISGPIVSVLTALGAVPLAQFAQRGREFRLRRAIEANIKIAAGLGEGQLTNEERLRSKIESILDQQIDALSRLEAGKHAAKLRDYGSLAVGTVFTALVTLPMWFMWRPEQWWSWTIFVVLGLLAFIFLASGLYGCFSQEANKRRLEKERASKN